MDTSTCKVREALVSTLEAHPALMAAPKSVFLPNGKKIIVHARYGHQLKFVDGQTYVVIHSVGGHITFVAMRPGEHVEVISRPDGLLQGADGLPGWSYELLELIRNARAQSN